MATACVGAALNKTQPVSDAVLLQHGENSLLALHLGLRKQNLIIVNMFHTAVVGGFGGGVVRLEQDFPGSEPILILGGFSKKPCAYNCESEPHLLFRPWGQEKGILGRCGCCKTRGWRAYHAGAPWPECQQGDHRPRQRFRSAEGYGALTNNDRVMSWPVWGAASLIKTEGLLGIRQKRLAD